MECDEYSIGEIVISVIVVIFIYFLSRYKLVVTEIQKSCAGTLEQAYAVVSEPNYFKYLFVGTTLTVILVGFSLTYIKYGNNSLNKIIISSINILLLILLVIVFKDSIFTIMVVFLCFAGLLFLPKY